jgi:hypothetical protein
MEFDLIAQQAIGAIHCADCGRATLRRTYVEAKREWNSGGAKPSPDDIRIE